MTRKLKKPKMYRALAYEPSEELKVRVDIGIKKVADLLNKRFERAAYSGIFTEEFLALAASLGGHYLSLLSKFPKPLRREVKSLAKKIGKELSSEAARTEVPSVKH